MDTMLHELCHNVHGPHNQAFHALWDQLRDEQQGLIMKGYTGEGFLSEGRRLGGGGGRRLPPPHEEARRLAREAAEKRGRQPTMGPGRRLGGTGPRPGEDIRRVISDAVTRRSETLKGCATDNLDERQIIDLADSATRNGFRTQAEEDEANEVAIAQALWELVQEDERKARSEKGKSSSSGLTSNEATVDKEASSRSDRGINHAPGGPSHVSQSKVAVDDSRVGGFASERQWTCGTCTLQNPAGFLCCDACGAERPQAKQKTHTVGRAQGAGETAKQMKKREGPVATIDLTQSPTRTRPGKTRKTQTTATATTTTTPKGDLATPSATALTKMDEAERRTAPAIWQCSFCGNVMEKKWWTCSTCGRMKDQS